MDERETFEQGYRLNKAKVYGLIGRYISDVCTIEDLVSHTFMQAWVHRHTFRGQSTYFTWLGSIAINSAINSYHYTRRRPAVNAHDFVLSGYTDEKGPLDTLISEEELAIIYGAINKLPLPLQQVVGLSIYHELNYEEVANILKIPLGTVKSRYNRARFLLKELLR